MPVIPILLSDTQRAVEYKIQIAGAVAEIQGELDDLNLWRRYYAGEQDLLLNDDQRAFLDKIIAANGRDRYPIDNKVAVVVNKLRRRVNVQGFAEPSELATVAKDAQPLPDNPTTAAEWAWVWWHANKMDSGERELYKMALRDGWAYVLVGHDGTKPTFSVEERWNGQYGIRFFWQNNHTKREPLYAVNHFYTRDPLNDAASNLERITLYTPSAIYKWIRLTDPAKQQKFFNIVGKDPDDDHLFQILDEGEAQWPIPWVDTQGKPLGLAVVPFIAPMGSVVAPVVGLQDLLNKTWIDVTALADQQGFGQIVVSYPGSLPPDSTTTTGSASGSKTTDDDGLGLRPGRVLEIGGGAAAQKLPADDMLGLHNTINQVVTAIASNSEMPLHYFKPLSGEVPSGAALDELSKPVGELADELTVSWSDAWQTLMVMAQRVDRVYGSSYKGEPVALMPRWKPQPVSPESEASALQPIGAIANAIKTLKEARVEHVAAVEIVGQLAGLSREQIDRLKQEKEPEPLHAALNPMTQTPQNGTMAGNDERQEAAQDER